jgi:hypothetical protein
VRRRGAQAGDPPLSDELAGTCRRVLEGNWRTGARDGVPYAYTCPSPGHYPWQWYWDSCFAAMAWRRFEPARARAELATLLAAATPDGFIGHTIFWERPLHGARLAFYNVRSRRDAMTSTIQPPLLAWAWRAAVGDPGEVEAIARHHDWLARHRDLDGDGLLWILQPDESGLDASPKFDPVWGPLAQGRPGFVRLVRRNRRLGFDLARVREAGGPIVCEVITNVLHGLSQLALGRTSITPALVERLYDPARGLFLDRVRPGDGQPPVETVASLAPLALPDLPEEIGRRLVEEHLLDPARFWLPVPPPSVAATDPAYSNRDHRLGLRRYWRGPTWVNAAFLVWLGLVRLGYDQAAYEMTDGLAAVMAREGLREYYEPRTGAGMGARDFAWSALVLELSEPDPRAAASLLTTA